MKNIKKLSILIVILSIVACSTIKTPPLGVNYERPLRNTKNVDFHYDLTYLDKDGNIQYDRNLWEATYKVIDNANEYLIIEMFLFNDLYNKDKENFPEFSKGYTERLVKKKKENPNLKIYILLDENNNFYGAFEHPFIKMMKDSGIDVIEVGIMKLKDTFPWYSPIWRTFIEPAGNPQGKGWIRNFYGPMWPKLTIRNLLRALNVKADHKKIFLNESEVIVSGANIHDPSYFNENVAIYTKGEITKDILDNIQKISQFSDKQINIENNFDTEELKKIDNKDDIFNSNIFDEVTDENYKIQYISEGKIGEHLDNDIDSLNSGDELIMGMYFLADNGIINRLIKAANRGVKIRIILDRSKDAFGISTNGIPNKPVSKKLKNKSNGKIEIKWYFTNNEQYHTKLTLMKKTDGSVIIQAGSANLIKKNIRGNIMDSNLRILSTENSKLTKDIYSYFDRLWDNKDGIFTLYFDDEPTTNSTTDLMYKILDTTQLGSF